MSTQGNNSYSPSSREMYDVIIVGAGISGICAAYRIQSQWPKKKIVILEGRPRLGGTWDLYKYPGIRSDSDMYTLGFPFNPWTKPKTIVDGSDILAYIKETAERYDIQKKMVFNRRVVESAWRDSAACWTLKVHHVGAEKKNDDAGPTSDDRSEASARNPDDAYQVPPGGVVEEWRGRFLFMCTGYYSYDHPYMPAFPGQESFRGKILHPQLWDVNLGYTGKKVVVIGSGATAITLAPELAKRAASCVMVQRTPTYIVYVPQVDGWAKTLRRFLPTRLVTFISKWKACFLNSLFYYLCRHYPNWAKKELATGVKAFLGQDADMKHFTPPYNPWDQRLCVTTDSDQFFLMVKQGKLEIVTDTIEGFTERGIVVAHPVSEVSTKGTNSAPTTPPVQSQSAEAKKNQEVDGKEKEAAKLIEADIVVVATGLNVLMLGGMKLIVNGKEVKPCESHCYRGVLVGEVPNMAVAIGYTNASWTLKCDLASQYVVRVMRYMDAHGYGVVTPQYEASLGSELAIDLASGYVQRAKDTMMRQGSVAPWKVYQNYIYDYFTMRMGSVHDKYLKYRKVE